MKKIVLDNYYRFDNIPGDGKWAIVNIEYWTDKPLKTIQKAVGGICNSGYEHKVDELKVFVNGNIKLVSKKWWQFWR